jgi:tyrocidine synthetase-3
MNDRKLYRLTHPQKRIWYTEMIYPHTSVGNLAGTLKIFTNVNHEWLNEAVNRMIRQNAVLRTKIVDIPGEEPQQYVEPFQQHIFEVVDYSGSANAAEEAKAWLDLQATEPFALFDSRLFHFVMVKVSESETWFHARVHHLIADGVSMVLIGNQVMDNYIDCMYGRSPQTELELPSYTEFMDSEAVYEQSARFMKDKSYFDAKFEKCEDYVGLKAYDIYQVSTKATRKAYVIPADVKINIEQFCKEHSCNTFSLFVSLIYIYLNKVTANEELVLGTNFLNRTNAREKQMLGMFVSTIPFHVKVDSSLDFIAFVKHVLKEQTGLIRHQKYPFNVLIHELREQNPLLTRLFGILVEYQVMNFNKAEEIMYGIDTHFNGHETHDFVLHIKDRLDVGQLTLDFDYRIDLFTENEIDDIFNGCMQLLNDALQHPGKKIAELSLLSKAERSKILFGFNNTQREYPQHQTIHGMVEEQAARTPQQPAILCDGEQLTYAELNERANRVAWKLRELGVGPGVYVGITMKRSSEMIVGALAILKAGGAYIPLEATLPKARMAHILGTLGRTCVVTTSDQLTFQEAAAELPNVTAMIYMDEASTALSGYPVHNPQPLAGPQDTAYTIFTSGSTGVPKGVVVAHRTAVNLIDWVNRTFEMGSSDRGLFITSLSFDLSVYDVFGMLAAGGSIRVATERELGEPEQLVRILANEPITFWDSAPAALQQLTAYFPKLTASSGERRRSLRLVFLSGDWIPLTLPDQVRAAFEGAQVVSLGGATEATIWSNYYPIEAIDPEWVSIPYGKPIQNASYYILDQHLQPCPIGVAGDLYIGGQCLAIGYLNAPELTAEKFIVNPFVAGEGARMYRTGDVARWRADGNMEFLGRVDHQVKIRGYRVELGEIGSQLIRHKAVREAIVIDREDGQGQKYLCAYIVAAEEIDGEQLKAYLAGELPAYMIPTYMLQLDSIPITSNGKVDRKALPEPDARMNETEAYTEAKNETEATLVELWQEVLGASRVGTHDNFFNLGGQSLKATALIARVNETFHTEIPLRELFRSPTIRGLAPVVQQAANRTYKPINPIAGERPYYQLSSAQSRLFILNQLNEADLSYNMPYVLQLDGELNLAQLERSFGDLVKRHEAFRTSFEMVDGEPVQKIIEHAAVNITVRDTNERQLREDIRLFPQPFDFGIAPLLRLQLLRVNDRRHLLLIDMHHIVSDGVSMDILIRELADLYSGIELAPLGIAYKDYAVWQNELIQSAAMAAKEQFWLDLYRESAPALNLPTDYPRPATKSDEGAQLLVRADRQLASCLRKAAQEQQVTMYMYLLAAYSILLYKYTGQEDIVIGSPAAGRLHADSENIVGMFVNMLALRSEPAGSKSVKDFIGEVRERTLLALEHQAYPFERLIDQLGVAKDFSRSPLFDAVLVMQSARQFELELEQLKVSAYDFDFGTAKYDLTIEAAETAESVELKFIYCARLFKRETIERLSAHLLRILQQMAHNPELPLQQLELLTAAEKQALLAGADSQPVQYPRELTIHRAFEQQVGHTPHGIALADRDQRFTYDELNRKANRLARHLKQSGAARNNIVAMLLDRSADMIVAMLAIIKAGAAYLPIDPDYPQDRIAFMLEDSGAALLLTQREIGHDLRGQFNVILIDEPSSYAEDDSNLDYEVMPEDLAYVIYTSGTTGKPKGVMIEHRNVIRLLIHDQMQFAFSDRDVWSMFHSYCFDFSVWEMYGALLYGGKLVIVPKMIAQSASDFLELLHKEQVTVLNQTPTAFYALAKEDATHGQKLTSIRYVIFGGEALKPAMLQSWYAKYPHIELINMYGITETTVHVTYKRLSSAELSSNCSNIGKAIPTLTTYIMDANQQLVPVGIVGELYVGGDGVGRGYLNRETLMKEKFISNPHNPAEKLYRSGDLARWLPGGEMEYLGRIDHQVKIRGFRIELGEVENSLLQHPAITEAVVLTKEERDGSICLCAYLQSASKLTVSELRKFMLAALPEYMIPSYFVYVDRIPMTANGKVDRRQLPEPSMQMDDGVEYVAPSNTIEAKLVRIWEEALGVSPIGVDQSFFELGGHSLKAALVVSRIHKEMQASVPLRVIFEAPTIRELAYYILESEIQLFEAIPVAETNAKAEYPVSSAQQRLYFLNQLDKEGISYNLPVMLMFEGRLDVQRLERSWNQLIQRHESLRTSFHWRDGAAVQKVHENVAAAVTVEQALSDAPDSIIAACIKPFELTEAPLARASVIACSDTKHLLVIDTHHIIADGMSVALLVQDLVQLYSNQRLPELRVQYKDFTLWQNRYFLSSAAQLPRDYWLNLYAGEIPVLQLPVDYARPKVQSFEGDRLLFKLDESFVHKLQRMAKETSSTPYMILLSAFQIMLSKYSGQEDIIVGTPVSGRSHADLEHIAGMFVNTLAIRSQPRGSQSFIAFLTEMKGTLLNAFEHQEYPFEALVEQLNIPRNMSRNPIFDVMFVLQNLDVIEVEQADFRIKPYTYTNKIAKFDLTLEIVDLKDELLVYFEYCTKLYKKATVEAWAAAYFTILDTIFEQPEILLKDICVISEEEKQRVVYGFNDTQQEYPQHQTIHGMVEEQAARTPQQPAILCDGQQLTYAELNERANRVAWKLRELGVGPGVYVGITMKRSSEMIIGALAILKAGGAYIPLEATLPKARMAHILGTLGRTCVVTTSDQQTVQEAAAELPNVTAMIYMDEASAALSGYAVDNPQPLAGPQDTAYTIFTSGSTGVPKGVVVAHRTAVNLIDWVNRTFEMGSSDRGLFITSLSFDLSVYDVFGMLAAGGSIRVATERELGEPEQLVRILANEPITFWDSAPAALQQLTAYFPKLTASSGERRRSLRLVFLSGDWIPLTLPDQVRAAFEGAQVVSLGGATEATIWSNYYPIEAIDPEWVSIPYGKPIQNASYYILDQHLQPCPIGVAGDLYIGGQCLAIGYLNAPELTAEKFIVNPFVAGEGARMYRTGDVARWRADGNMEFLGRVDHQVKIRGYRVELGEIGSQLIRHKAVREAIVIDREDGQGQKYLCAYIVAAEEIDGEQLKAYLAGELPAYMIPTYMLQLDSIPITSNGKVDRKALPEPDARMNETEAYTEAKNETEAKLVELWQEVLGASQVGTHDNFFNLGGQSLKATALMASINEAFDIGIPLSHIFQFPTISQLAPVIAAFKELGSQTNETLALLGQPNRKPVFCFPPITGYGIVFKAIADALTDYSVYAFDFVNSDELLQLYIDQMLMVQKHGPYTLLGYSAGGNIAFELAKLMEEQGHQVEQVILLDSLRREAVQQQATEEIERDAEALLDEVAWRYGSYLNHSSFRSLVTQRIVDYSHYLNGLVNDGRIQAAVRYVSSEEYDFAETWLGSSVHEVEVYQGSGKHVELLQPGFIDWNTQVIRGILDGVMIAL